MNRRSMRAASIAMLVLTALLPLQCLARQPDDILGALSRYKTIAGDNLLDVAQHFEVGYVDIVAANPGIDPSVCVSMEGAVAGLVELGSIVLVDVEGATSQTEEVSTPENTRICTDQSSEHAASSS